MWKNTRSHDRLTCVYGLLPDVNEHDDNAVTEIGCSRISGLW
jgi:hypothetical protein